MVALGSCQLRSNKDTRFFPTLSHPCTQNTFTFLIACCHTSPNSVLAEITNRCLFLSCKFVLFVLWFFSPACSGSCPGIGGEKNFMISFNQCVFVGNVGTVPELKKTKDDVSVCRFRLAVQDYASKSAEGEKKEPLWLTVNAWRSLAEQVSTYVKKGSLVLVSGRLAVHTYTDKTNVERTEVEVIASEVRFLDQKPQTPEQTQEPQEEPAGA